MDELDTKIIDELSRSSRDKVQVLAKKLGIPKSTVHNRIKRLEKEGVIVGYRAIIDYEKIGKEITAFITIVVMENHFDDVIKRLLQDPRVEDIYTITGRYDIIAKIRFYHTKDIASFLYNIKGPGLGTWNGVQKTETAIVFGAFMEDGIRKNINPESGEIRKPKPYTYQKQRKD